MFIHRSFYPSVFFNEFPTLASLKIIPKGVMTIVHIVELLFFTNPFIFLAIAFQISLKNGKKNQKIISSFIL
jgi:hypothetical protein